MIRINLLPHRAIRREKRKKDFLVHTGLSALLGAAMAMGIGMAIASRIEWQDARNRFITDENAKLDAQIKEIGQLKQDIEALTARQNAVENLQRDRTIPVHVFDELVRLTPAGIFLRQVRHEDRKVQLSGWAQSNEQVSQLLRGLAQGSAWLERPELVEIKATNLGSGSGGAAAKDSRRVFEFVLNTLIKAPQDPAAGKAAEKGPGKAAPAGSPTPAPASAPAPGSPPAPAPGAAKAG